MVGKIYMKTVPVIGGNIKLVSPLEAKTHHPVQIGFETQQVHFDDVTVSCSSWTVPELLLVVLSSYASINWYINVTHHAKGCPKTRTDNADRAQKRHSEEQVDFLQVPVLS